MDFRQEGLCLYYRDALNSIQHTTDERTDRTEKSVTTYAVTTYQIELSDDDLIEEICEVADVPQWVKDQWCKQIGSVLVAEELITKEATLQESSFRNNPRNADHQPKAPVFEVRCKMSEKQRRLQYQTALLRSRINDLGRGTNHGSPPQGENPLQKFTGRAGDYIRVCPLQTPTGRSFDDAETRWLAGLILDSQAREDEAHSQQDVRTEIPPRKLTSLNMSVVSVCIGGATFNMDG